MSASQPRQSTLVGLSVDDFLEREMGCPFHQAMLLGELGSALYAVEEEYRHDDRDELGIELAAKAAELHAFIDRLSITEEGRITLNRECRRCSGNGQAGDVNGCAECAGEGYVHADEAEG